MKNFSLSTIFRVHVINRFFDLSEVVTIKKFWTAILIELIFIILCIVITHYLLFSFLLSYPGIGFIIITVIAGVLLAYTVTMTMKRLVNVGFSVEITLFLVFMPWPIIGAFSFKYVIFYACLLSLLCLLPTGIVSRFFN